jgi:D-aminoacyl-tRNA deacylase
VRVVLQRVARASVSVDDDVIASIGPGLLLFVGVGHDDGQGDAQRLADKIATLRIFPDQRGVMHRSIADVAGQALVVSQFTLFADLSRGRRPSFSAAADPVVAAPLVEAFAGALQQRGMQVARGRFGADMQVDLVNDGPVTLVLDSSSLRRGDDRGA